LSYHTISKPLAAVAVNNALRFTVTDGHVFVTVEAVNVGAADKEG
jgi:hypothetical protein